MLILIDFWIHVIFLFRPERTKLAVDLSAKVRFSLCLSLSEYEWIDGVMDAERFRQIK